MHAKSEISLIYPKFHKMVQLGSVVQTMFSMNSLIRLHKRTASFAAVVFLVLSVIIATAQNTNSLESGFRQPPENAGIRCFWWWLNSNVTRDAITRDLEQMKAKGFSGALIFDADGSSQRENTQVPAGPVFGSPEWTELFVHACNEANRLDLELSLNLQSGWNLGGPKVTETEATQHLVWSKTEVKGGVEIEQPLKRPVQSFYRDVAVLAVPLVEGNDKTQPIKNLNLKSATSELGMSAPDTRFLLDSEPAAEGARVVDRSDILDLTALMDDEGVLRWQVPPGRWEVLRIGHAATGAHVSTHSAGWGGRVLDYLNPTALDHYWMQNIDPLIKAIGPLAGKTLRYVHTDSWEGGGMNWTPGFAKIFRQRRGYDPLPWLAVLAGHVVENHEASDAFLADFRKTIGELVADHYGHLAKLAARHGMGTHPESSGPHAGSLDGLKNYGHSSLVMSEFWSPSPHRATPESRFFVKQASSAAHTYGKRLVGAEGFTTIGPHWNDVAWSQMKPSADREFCAGLNMIFVHTFTCSPLGMGLPGQEYFAGTHFNPQITWWNETPVFIDYLRRCQFLVQQGDFVADVLHYYGDHIPNVFGNKAQDPAGALPGYDYDVLSEELLIGALKVEDGRLTLPSGMRYRLLSLPDHRVLSLGALKKIHELVRDGATVLGPKPLKTVSLEGGTEGRNVFLKLADELWGQGELGASGVNKFGKGRVVWGKTATEWLSSDGVHADVEMQLASDGSPAPDTDWIHYRMGGADVYFLAHMGKETREITASFRIAGRVPELWNAVDGSIREANTFRFAEGRTSIPLKLEPYESAFIVFRKAAVTGRNARPNTLEWENLAPIDGPWQVTFDPTWGGPKAPVRFTELESWTQRDEPGVKHYSGKARYRTTFNYDPSNVAQGRRVAVELGSVADLGIAQVFVNGKDLGVVWRPPFRCDITDVVKPGENLLEVDVVNSWRNRLVGDKDLPQNERLTRTNIRVTWDLSPSGLMGPVRLTTSEPVHK